jgi:hypothetical protein
MNTLSIDELNAALNELDAAPETMSDARLRNSAAQMGKQLSEEHKQKVREATSKALRGKRHTPEWTANHAKSAGRRCTVDGVTIYDSAMALRRALGLRSLPANVQFLDELTEGRQAYRKRRAHACTVDDITIYPSTATLAKALGQGKHGLKHPNFHTTDAEANVRDEDIVPRFGMGRGNGR